MKSRITRFLLTLAIAAPITRAAVNFGSSAWMWQNPLPLGNGLNAISCPGATTCFAVGDLSTIRLLTSFTRFMSVLLLYYPRCKF